MITIKPHPNPELDYGSNYTVNATISEEIPIIFDKLGIGFLDAMKPISLSRGIAIIEKGERARTTLHMYSRRRIVAIYAVGQIALSVDGLWFITIYGDAVRDGTIVTREKAIRLFGTYHAWLEEEGD